MARSDRALLAVRKNINARRINSEAYQVFACGLRAPFTQRQIVLVGAAFIPYVDRGDIHVTRPSQRKTAVVLFTLFCILGLVLTFVGIFFRGPGYTFIIPYITAPGVYFAL